MPKPVTAVYQRAFSGTPKRIFQLLSDLGTSADAVWPSASQPFMRTAGPLVVGQSEEWHGGVHAVLDQYDDERCIVWRYDMPGVEGTHGFYLSPDKKKTLVQQKIDAVLSDTDGRAFWKRYEDVHEMMIEGLFDKLTKVLKR